MANFVAPQSTPTVTTNDYVTVTASIINGSDTNLVKLAVQEVGGANGITARLVGRYVTRDELSNVVNVSAWTAVGDPSVIVAGATGTLQAAIDTTHYDQYAAQVKSTVNGTPGRCYVFGHATNVVQVVSPIEVTFDPIELNLWVDPLADEAGDGSVTAPFQTLQEAFDAMTEENALYVITLAMFDYATGEPALEFPVGGYAHIVSHLSNVDVVVETGFLTVDAYGGEWTVTANGDTNEFAFGMYGHSMATLVTDATAAPEELRIEAFDVEEVTFAGGERAITLRNVPTVQGTAYTLSKAEGCRFDLTEVTSANDSEFFNCEFLANFTTAAAVTTIRNCVFISAITFAGDENGAGAQVVEIDLFSRQSMVSDGSSFNADFAGIVLDSVAPTSVWHVSSLAESYFGANGSRELPFEAIQDAIDAAEAHKVADENTDHIIYIEPGTYTENLVISEDSMRIHFEGFYTQVGTITFSSGKDMAGPDPLICFNSPIPYGALGDLTVTCQGCDPTVDWSRIYFDSFDCSGVQLTHNVYWYVKNGGTNGNVVDRADPDQIIYGQCIAEAWFGGTLDVLNMGSYIVNTSFEGAVTVGGGSYAGGENVFTSCSFNDNFDMLSDAAAFDQATQMKSASIGTVTGTVSRGGLCWALPLGAATTTDQAQAPGYGYDRVWRYNATGALNFTIPDAANYALGEELAVFEIGNAFAITLVPDGGDTLYGTATVQGGVALLKKIDSAIWARV